MIDQYDLYFSFITQNIKISLMSNKSLTNSFQFWRSRKQDNKSNFDRLKKMSNKILYCICRFSDNKYMDRDKKYFKIVCIYMLHFIVQFIQSKVSSK